MSSQSTGPSHSGGDLLAVVGNPRPGSRTAGVAVAALTAAAAAAGVAAPVAGDLLDLGAAQVELGPPLGSDSASRYAGPLGRLHAARLAVVATPTYKGSYTGLLKAFLDHVAAGALHRTVVIPLITVGSPAHTLAADLHLRPLLVELGAVTPTASVVVSEADLADAGRLAALLDAWAERAAPALRALLADQAS